MCKIISGGQTGIDQLGLDIAMAVGLETGGTAAKGWMTEIGPMETLLKSYGLVECDKPGYPARTWKNVMDSDMTVIFGDEKSIGSANTIRYCKVLGKPCLINPNAEQLRQAIVEHKVLVLNVAGNRASKLSTDNEALAKMTMYTIFISLKIRQDEDKNKALQGKKTQL